MKEIPLTQGKVALVDDADYDAVSQFKWYAWKRASKPGRFYAARKIRSPDGKRAVQFLHRFLMPGVPQIDHRDGNGLNNQRENIRPATHQQNARGFRHKRIGATAKFRGGSWDRRRLKWKVKIVVNGKDRFLGYFESEEDAARAYDAAALKYFGEFASPNFKAA